MNQLNKKNLFAFAVLLLTLFAKNALAQYPGMREVNSRISMQQLQQQMDMQMMIMGRSNGNDIYNYNYDFTITFKDASKKVVNSKIYMDTVVKKSYLLLVDKTYAKSDSNRKKKIYPSQTLSISREYNSIAVSVHANAKQKPSVPISGIPADSCWMFKVVSGSINAYSFLSEPESQFFAPSSIVGIQTNDGPIIKYNEENLMQMVGQDIDALNQIKKKNYYRALKKHNHNTEKAQNN